MYFRNRSSIWYVILSLKEQQIELGAIALANVLHEEKDILCRRLYDCISTELTITAAKRTMVTALFSLFFLTSCTQTISTLNFAVLFMLYRNARQMTENILHLNVTLASHLPPEIV
jgi:hypothetical protein